MSAPKGNKFAVGNPNSGRPYMYETPEEFAAAADAYFEWCKGEFQDRPQAGFPIVEGVTVPTERVWVRPPEPVTITGLTLWMGFAHRKFLVDYAKVEGYEHVVARAKLRVENAYEQKLSGNNVAGPIFYLKNHGWHDTQRLGNDPENPLFTEPLILKMPDGMDINLPSNTEGDV